MMATIQVWPVWLLFLVVLLNDGIGRYQGIADTIVQLSCLSASGVIALVGLSLNETNV
jgi:hypothetical protein